MFQRVFQHKVISPLSHYLVFSSNLGKFYFILFFLNFYNNYCLGFSFFFFYLWIYVFIDWEIIYKTMVLELRDLGIILHFIYKIDSIGFLLLF